MTVDILMAVLEKHGPAALIIAVLAWAYWKKDQRLGQVQDQAWAKITDMTLAMKDVAHMVDKLRLGR